MSEAERTKLLAHLNEKLDDQTAYRLKYDWSIWARPEQLPPPGDWAYWAVIAGRGFGKTRTGSEWVRKEIKTKKLVNLMGSTADDVRDIMIEGESGILRCCPADERPIYKKHEAKLVWPNGAESLCFTAEEPDRARGKQHFAFWGDELAAWRYDDAWDQMQFGLRLGEHPRALVTTTPRPRELVRRIIKDPNTVVTRGTTYDNKANLAPTFYSQIIGRYEGTRLGRQELNAEILEDVPGALWRRSQIDADRIEVGDTPELKRIVVSVDPAISTEEGSDQTGIIAAALGVDNRGYVLADDSGSYSPDEWARRALALYRWYDADCIVAERNQGGDMVERTIRSAAPPGAPLSVRMVHASKGKATRAEPIAALYEQGRISHAGTFDTLEDQMCVMTPDFDRKKEGWSPDAVDALVWGLTELFPQMTRRARSGDQPKRRRRRVPGGGAWMTA